MADAPGDQVTADAAGREVVGEALAEDRELQECAHGFGYVPCSHGCDPIVEVLVAHRLSEFDRDNDQHPCPEPCEWKWSPRDVRDREFGYQARRRQHDAHVAEVITQALADRAQTDEAGLRAAECWGVAIPEPDGFINPGQVKYASSPEGARHKAEVYGEGHVVVHRHITEWVAAADQPDAHE